jgi:phosphoribosyl-ATP pyrophosphohydrolase
MDHIRALYDDIRTLRATSAAKAPRTQRLIRAGRLKKAKKVGEEAVEVALEAVIDNKDTTIKESVDLIYNLVVLWEDMGIKPSNVWDEMSERRQRLGISEKLPKKKTTRAKKAAGKRKNGDGSPHRSEASVPHLASVSFVEVVPTSDIGVL